MLFLRQLLSSENKCTEWRLKWEALLISERPTLDRVKTLWQIGLDLRQDAFQTREENLLTGAFSLQYRNKSVAVEKKYSWKVKNELQQ